jgi:hypothetical protein
VLVDDRHMRATAFCIAAGAHSLQSSSPESPVFDRT